VFLSWSRIFFSISASVKVSRNGHHWSASPVFRMATSNAGRGFSLQQRKNGIFRCRSFCNSWLQSAATAMPEVNVCVREVCDLYVSFYWKAKKSFRRFAVSFFTKTEKRPCARVNRVKPTLVCTKSTEKAERLKSDGAQATQKSSVTVMPTIRSSHYSKSLNELEMRSKPCSIDADNLRQTTRCERIV